MYVLFLPSSSIIVSLQRKARLQTLCFQLLRCFFIMLFKMKRKDGVFGLTHYPYYMERYVVWFYCVCYIFHNQGYRKLLGMHRG